MNTTSGMSVKAIRLRERNERLSAAPIPSTLEAPSDATATERATYTTATHFYRDVVIAGDDGAPLDSLGFIIGKDEKKAALEVLRVSGSVVESLEMRQGSKRRQRVFRPAHSDFG